MAACASWQCVFGVSQRGKEEQTFFAPALRILALVELAGRTFGDDKQH